MKKLTVFFAVLLLCMLCLLAGCQEADETTADKAADTTAAEITTKEEESLFIFEGEHASVLPKGETPEKLDDNVDVVTPSEFIRRITEYVDHSE